MEDEGGERIHLVEQGDCNLGEQRRGLHGKLATILFLGSLVVSEHVLCSSFFLMGPFGICQSRIITHGIFPFDRQMGSMELKLVC